MVDAYAVLKSAKAESEAASEAVSAAEAEAADEATLAALLQAQTEALQAQGAAQTALDNLVDDLGLVVENGTVLIPNVAPDEGLTAPFNSWMTLFGQFFDHGLDLVNKGGSGTVYMPLQPDDPLYVEGSHSNFMLLTRATNQPGPDGVLGTDDDVRRGINQTTPFIDQNQTYTSHASQSGVLTRICPGGGQAGGHRAHARWRQWWSGYLG